MAFLKPPLMRRLGSTGLLLAGCLCSATVAAGPWLAPGDRQIRSDIQLLADYGALEIPVSSWPVSWPDISTALQKLSPEQAYPYSVLGALKRVRRRLAEEYAFEQLRGDIRLTVADKPSLLNGFGDAPAYENEITAGAEWHNDRYAWRLQGGIAESDGDTTWLTDGSYVASNLGNWSVSFDRIDRWWGPGWDGSLILSNNARPVPAITLQRRTSTPFESKWLSWLGPWQFTTFLGQMESERHVPDTKLWGARFAFKPLRNLEIGLSRAAQFGGEGRSEDLSTLWNVLIGNDNVNDELALDPEDEPGNQLGGYDVRWRLPYRLPVAVYAQLIGEDESVGLPTAMMHLAGVEFWGYSMLGPFRTYAEFADTATYRTSVGYNTAYNHHIYKSGYRYYGDTLGHSMDNDGRSISVGMMFATKAGNQWLLHAQQAELNRDGSGLNLVSSTAQDYRSVSLENTIQKRDWALTWAIGHEELKEKSSGAKESETSISLSLQYIL